MEKYIRFEWAMKRILREKANHEVLEGFIESLIGDKFLIVDILESEGNQRKEDDNRIEMLAKNDKDELFIFEIQNEGGLNYFQKMMFGGTSDVVAKYVKRGVRYSEIKKVYNINITYLEPEQGNDYVYHAQTNFSGLNDNNDSLMQKISCLGEPFLTEYFILSANNFDKEATTPLDEWVEFLKTSEIKPGYTAPGLDKVRECLRLDSLSEIDRDAYLQYLGALFS